MGVKITTYRKKMYNNEETNETYKIEYIYKKVQYIEHLLKKLVYGNN